MCVKVRRPLRALSENVIGALDGVQQMRWAFEAPDWQWGWHHLQGLGLLLHGLPQERRRRINFCQREQGGNKDRDENGAREKRAAEDGEQKLGYQNERSQLK